MNEASAERRYIFGPVPSRRLGKSLGVDLVPYKTCTFDCIYCDLGRTTLRTTTRNSYVPLDEVRKELNSALTSPEKKPDYIYITISGSGEPTLNENLGKIVHHIKERTSTPLAVLTNGSLLFVEEVRRDLLEADVVLPSLDAVSELTFHALNRPYPSLRIEEIVSGLIRFRKEYRGQIWLEVVLCRGMNDTKKEIEKLKGVIESIEPDRIQLNTPVRPPAEEFAYPLALSQLEEIRERFEDRAEVVSEYRASLGEEPDSVKDTEILSLIKRRPCTTEEISKALGLRIDEVVKHLGRLTRQGLLRYRLHERQCYFEFATPNPPRE